VRARRDTGAYARRGTAPPARPPALAGKRANSAERNPVASPAPLPGRVILKLRAYCSVTSDRREKAKGRGVGGSPLATGGEKTPPGPVRHGLRGRGDGSGREGWPCGRGSAGSGQAPCGGLGRCGGTGRAGRGGKDAKSRAAEVVARGGWHRGGGGPAPPGPARRP